MNRVYEVYKKMIVEESHSFTGGNHFNVFNVIGLWSEEVRLHSAMIRELLDPSGSHGCSDQFLKIFLRKVLNINNIAGKTSLTRAIVDSEFYIGQISADRDEGGRIDIIVNIPENLNIPSIIIENKIYAPDQENQLLRYHKYGIKTFPNNNFLLVYLTLSGSNPSDWSLGTGTAIVPKCISYINDIIPWLQSCAQIAFDKPKVRETIIQYIDLLQQITDNSMNHIDEIVNEVATDENLIPGLLICSRKNELVRKAILGPISNILGKVAENAKHILDNLQVEFKPSDIIEPRGKIDWNFKFLISSSDGKRQVCLKYTFGNGDLSNLYYGIDCEKTVGVPLGRIFSIITDEWPYGWDWVKEEYKTWNCNTICIILEQIKEKGIDSDFAKEVLETIKKAADYLRQFKSNS